MNNKLKIVITDFIADELTIEKTIAGDIAEIQSLNASSERELEGHIDDADAIIMYHTLSIGRTTIDRLRKCKLIVRAGVGVDNIDHLYARKLGLPVANVPDYGSEEVADTAIGMVLSLTRGIEADIGALHQQGGCTRACPSSDARHIEPWQIAKAIDGCVRLAPL